MFREIDGEAVLLELDSGRYYGLDEVGTRMWHALARHRRVEAAAEELLDEYEVAAERLRSDLLAFVEQLADQGLLIVQETAATAEVRER